MSVKACVMCLCVYLHEHLQYVVNVITIKAFNNHNTNIFKNLKIFFGI